MADALGEVARRYWETIVDLLPEDEGRVVSAAVADGVLEGWRPSLRNLELLVGLATGALSFDQYRRRVLADVDRNEPAVDEQDIAENH